MGCIILKNNGRRNIGVQLAISVRGFNEVQITMILVRALHMRLHHSSERAGLGDMVSRGGELSAPGLMVGTWILPLSVFFFPRDGKFQLSLTSETP